MLDPTIRDHYRRRFGLEGGADATDWLGVNATTVHPETEPKPWTIEDLTKAVKDLEAMGPIPPGEAWVSHETLAAIQRSITVTEDRSRLLFGIALLIDEDLPPGHIKYDGRVFNLFKSINRGENSSGV